MERTPDGRYVVLGERGTPWWEQISEQRRARWEGGIEPGASP